MLSALQHAAQHHETYLGQLIEFLRFPSISTLSQHRPDIQRTAEWLAAEMARIGLLDVQVMPTDGCPVVFGQHLAAGPDAPTVLLYGHYDVQPVDPLSAWHSPPFEPAVRDGAIYARGASDNKGQHFCHLKAIESMLAANRELPLNIKLCIDGEEESGSPNLPPFIAAHQDLLACDHIVISDGSMAGEDRPSIQYACRGVIDLEMHVRGPNRDLHSGSFGGTVHNPAQALAEIISSLHDQHGRVAIPGFYDDVLELRPEERQLLARVGYSQAQWQGDTGLQQSWGETAYSLLERMTARPTCEVNGIWGGFSGEGGKTIIPAEAGAKLSCRLVAKQDPERIGQLIVQHIQDTCPATVAVEVKVMQGARAAVTPFEGPLIKAAARALQEVWGVEAVISRMGGSLPVVAEFQQHLGVPFVLIPLGLDDNRHSPNEHYRLDYFRRGIQTAIRFYHYLAQQAASKQQ